MRSVAGDDGRSVETDAGMVRVVGKRLRIPADTVITVSEIQTSRTWEMGQIKGP